MITPESGELSPIVTIENLSLRFPGASRPVFDELSLSLQRGEFVALVGGSGVGKSTLLRVIANLISPTSGHVIFRSDPRPGRRRRSFVFQDSRLLPWRTLAGNIAFGLEGLALSRAERAKRIVEVLDLTLLSEFAARWPHQLSGGQQQRGGIARALAVKPDLLLMDEPFSSVDAITRQVLQDELLRIWQASGPAILFVTHDINEAVLLADRILVMKGSPARLILDVHVDLVRPRQRMGTGTFKLLSDIASAL